MRRVRVSLSERQALQGLPPHLERATRVRVRSARGVVVTPAHIAWKLEQGHELSLSDAQPARLAVALGLVALVRWVSS